MYCSFGGGEAMRWNLEEHMTYGLMLNEDHMTHGISDKERKDMMEISDFISQNYDDVHNVFTVMSPHEAFDDEDISIHLPKDPFGPDFTTTDHLDSDLSKDTTIAAITDWIVDFLLEADEFEDGCKVFEYENIDDYEILTEKHFVWTSFSKPARENELIDYTNRSNEGNDTLGAEAEELSSGCDIYHNGTMKDDDRDGSSSAHYALNLFLNYLCITDLLNVEGVCRSLRDEVRTNAALWQHIKIDSSLSLKMKDERLMWLTDRAQGSLRSLDLFNCFNVTNVSLRHVLKCNPELTKLDLVGCRKVNVEALLQDLKGFNTINSPGIKYLRVGELNGLTNEHVKEFQRLLGVNEGITFETYIPRYHFVDQLYLSLDDERALDIETCPKCKKPKQVFDCPLASCKEKVRSQNECRGCFQCIARCICCGCCLGDKPYEETFFFDLCCMDCSSYHLPPENQEIHVNDDEAYG